MLQLYGPTFNGWVNGIGYATEEPCGYCGRIFTGHSYNAYQYCEVCGVGFSHVDVLPLRDRWEFCSEECLMNYMTAEENEQTFYLNPGWYAHRNNSHSGYGSFENCSFCPDLVCYERICTRCSGTGVVTNKNLCEHGLFDSHSYCSHGYTTQHD